MGVAKGRVGRAAAEDGEVVAFAPCNLRGEHFVEGASQFWAVRDGHGCLLAVDQPIEVAPDFAAVNHLRPFGLRQLAQGLDAAERAADMGVMFIGEVMQVDDFRSARFEDAAEVVADGGLLGVANGGAAKA